MGGTSERWGGTRKGEAAFSASAGDFSSGSSRVALGVGTSAASVHESPKLAFEML